MKRKLLFIPVLFGLLLSACGPTPAKPVLPESITLNFAPNYLEIGDTYQLLATILPEKAQDSKVTWSVTDGYAVSVDQDGLVSAEYMGMATVTATTVNGLSASKTFTVVEKIVNPTGISLDTQDLTLRVNETHTFIATLFPNNVTDRSVTYIASNSKVRIENNKLTALEKGTCTVTAYTSVEEVYATCNVTIKRAYPTSIDAYVTDLADLVSGKPEQLVGGAYVPVEIKDVYEGRNIYEFNYNTTIRFPLAKKEFATPTGMKVNGTTYDLNKDGYVYFQSLVRDIDDEDFFFLDCKVEYTEDIPVTGSYSFQITDAPHILIRAYDENNTRVLGCDMGDTITIKPKITSEDYEVKQLYGYTVTDVSSGSKKTLDFTKNTDGSYTFKCPYSADGIIRLEISEINNTLFRGSPLVGSYLLLRTYGLSESSMFIDDFVKNTDGFIMVTFAESGEITYGDRVAYTTSASDGIIHAQYGNSTVEFRYANNMMILGLSSDGSSFSTVLSPSDDIAICIKAPIGIGYADIKMDNKVMKINGEIHALFNFFVSSLSSPIASAYIVKSTKTIYMDTRIVLYHGENVKDDTAVFKVTTNSGTTLAKFGYVDEGGKGNYVLNPFENGYTNNKHTLVFINGEKALFDDEIFTIRLSTGTVVELSQPLRLITIALDNDNMTFTVTGDEEIIPIPLDIANKTYVGTAYNPWDECNQQVSILFGASNTSITGIYTQKANVNFYWRFTGEYDFVTSIITITVVDRGYNGSTSNFDSSIGRVAHLYVEGNTVKFLDNISTQTNVYVSKNVVLTVVDN